MNCLPSVTRSRQLSCLQNVSAPSPTLRNSRQGRGHVHTALTGRSAHASGILNARLVRAAAGLCTLFLAVAGFASAQFGSQAIGASATQTVTVPITGSATVNSVQVLTFGTQGQDFQANGTFNCAAQSCMQPVTFTALYPGLRSGAVVALDSSNNVLGTTYISGTGTGGLGVLIPGTTFLRYKQPHYTTVDASIGVQKGQWSLEVFGSNLTNSHASTFTSSAQFIRSEVPLRPRVIEMKIGLDF